MNYHHQKNQFKKEKHRRGSSIIGLRMFHNWVKRTILEETVEYLKTNYNNHNLSLLDLAVGRGGDMNKWYDLRINKVVGIDIDGPSIDGKNGAKERYGELVQRLQSKNRRVPDYKFHVIDLSDRANADRITDATSNQKFDIVSCQFALHYFFETEEKLDFFIGTVAKYIAKNGFFIGTTLDGTKINELFSKSGNIIKKRLYYLEDKTENNNSVYGQTYIASLGEKEGETHYFVDKASTEYKVDVEELKRVCHMHGLTFVGVIPFESWYDKYKGTSPKYDLGIEEKEFSFLNFSFVFKKC